ncbi:MAG: NAD(+) diphosphatase [Gammaproteobacteria bacterium]|nr:MAG: NAD(+) diphosphatase [Gammaproteobacteria bacterium]
MLILSFQDHYSNPPDFAFTHSEWHWSDDYGVTDNIDNATWVIDCTSTHIFLPNQGRTVEVAAPPTHLVWLSRRQGIAARLWAAPFINAAGVWRPLRACLGMDDWKLTWYSRGVLIAHWLQHHRFCAACGSQLVPDSGLAQKCSQDNCARTFFPRIDPAIITTITNARGELLLARQAHWPANRFSVIAGFVMPGETVEQSVKREVMEETGLTIHSCRYVASQPWPFPSSLMLAFDAYTQEIDIHPNDQELETIAWFSAPVLMKKIQSGELIVGGQGSISRFLIHRWLEQHLAQHTRANSDE